MDNLFDIRYACREIQSVSNEDSWRLNSSRKPIIPGSEPGSLRQIISFSVAIFGSFPAGERRGEYCLDRKCLEQNNEDLRAEPEQPST
jgi:hypothetical protein